MLINTGPCVQLAFLERDARGEDRAEIDADRAADAARAEQDHRARCSAEGDRRKARLAELGTKVAALRARREEAQRTRSEDESWVREHCRWENDPRYAIEVQRQRGSGDEPDDYDVQERYAGVSRSVAKCPRGTSKRRLLIADQIGNRLVDPNGAALVANIMRENEDKAAGAPGTTLSKAEQDWWRRPTLKVTASPEAALDAGAMGF